MTETWFKLVQFLTGQFGLPGSCAVGIAVYLAYLLKKEREAHDKTRDSIVALQEKRIELNATYMLLTEKLKDALEACVAYMGKKP
mgnify:CR=1 FL=1